MSTMPSTTASSNASLPQGWVEQWNSEFNAPYYVDTNQSPPVSHWERRTATTDRGLMSTVMQMASGSKQSGHNQSYGGHQQPHKSSSSMLTSGLGGAAIGLIGSKLLGGNKKHNQHHSSGLGGLASFASPNGRPSGFGGGSSGFGQMGGLMGSSGHHGQHGGHHGHHGGPQGGHHGPPGGHHGGPGFF